MVVETELTVRYEMDVVKGEGEKASKSDCATGTCITRLPMVYGVGRQAACRWGTVSV